MCPQWSTIVPRAYWTDKVFRNVQNRFLSNKLLLWVTDTTLSTFSFSQLPEKNPISQVLSFQKSESQRESRVFSFPIVHLWTWSKYVVLCVRENVTMKLFVVCNYHVLIKRLKKERIGFGVTLRRNGSLGGMRWPKTKKETPWIFPFYREESRSQAKHKDFSKALSKYLAVL